MKELTPEQKQQLTISLFGVVSLLIIILAFLQIRNNLYAPFAAQKNGLPVADTLVLSTDAGSGLNQAEAERLKKADTDSDGLTDYEELYQYHTSPYLKDSDGDGLDDKTEITQGTDPNCPKGKNCGISGEVSKDSQVSIVPSSPTLPSSPQDYAIQAATIRGVLTKAGIDAALLKKFDDKSLVELYNESVKESGVKPDTLSQALVQNSQLSPEALRQARAQIERAKLTATQLTELKKLSPADLRVKLLQLGYFDQKTLDSVTDEQLRQTLDQLKSPSP